MIALHRNTRIPSATAHKTSNAGSQDDAYSLWKSINKGVSRLDPRVHSYGIYPMLNEVGKGGTAPASLITWGCWAGWAGRRAQGLKQASSLVDRTSPGKQGGTAEVLSSRRWQERTGCHRQSACLHPRAPPQSGSWPRSDTMWRDKPEMFSFYKCHMNSHNTNRMEKIMASESSCHILWVYAFTNASVFSVLGPVDSFFTSTLQSGKILPATAFQVFLHSGSRW